MKKLTAAEIKQLAKELKVKNWWTKKRADLVSDIVEIKGWTDHTPENIEFLLAGGTVTKLPDAGIPPEKLPRESSATQLTDENEKWKNRNKKKRKAKKSSKDKTPKGEKKPAKKTEGQVTLANICEELNVEPRVARRKLRNSDITKPESGWSWEEGHSDIQAVKDLLK